MRKKYFSLILIGIIVLSVSLYYVINSYINEQTDVTKNTFTETPIVYIRNINGRTNNWTIIKSILLHYKNYWESKNLTTYAIEVVYSYSVLNIYVKNLSVNTYMNVRSYISNNTLASISKVIDLIIYTYEVIAPKILHFYRNTPEAIEFINNRTFIDAYYDNSSDRLILFLSLPIIDEYTIEGCYQSFMVSMFYIDKTRIFIASAIDFYPGRSIIHEATEPLIIHFLLHPLWTANGMGEYVVGLNKVTGLPCFWFCINRGLGFALFTVSENDFKKFYSYLYPYLADHPSKRIHYFCKEHCGKLRSNHYWYNSYRVVVDGVEKLLNVTITINGSIHRIPIGLYGVYIRGDKWHVCGEAVSEYALNLCRDFWRDVVIKYAGEHGLYVADYTDFAYYTRMLLDYGISDYVPLPLDKGLAYFIDSAG